MLRTVCQIHNLLSTHFCAAHLLHICLDWQHMLCTLFCKQVSFSIQVFLSGNSSAVVNSSLISPLLPFHPTFRDSQSYSSAAALCTPCHSETHLCSPSLEFRPAPKPQPSCSSADTSFYFFPAGLHVAFPLEAMSCVPVTPQAHKLQHVSQKKTSQSSCYRQQGINLSNEIK